MRTGIWKLSEEGTVFLFFFFCFRVLFVPFCTARIKFWGRLTHAGKQNGMNTSLD